MEGAYTFVLQSTLNTMIVSIIGIILLGIISALDKYWLKKAHS